MATCECCQQNEGEAREWQTIMVGTDQGDVPKRVPSKWLCEACNDDRLPHFDGSGVRACPHGV